MTNSIILAGAASRIFNNLAKLNTNGNLWIPQTDAINFVKKESLKVTKNGIYDAPKGICYDRIIVKVKRKDRAKAGTSAPTGGTEEEITPTIRNVSIKQIRETQTFQGVEKINTKSTNGDTITWVPEEDASYYVGAETLTIEENGTYNAENGKLYNRIIVHVAKDEDDENAESNLNLITKEITANGTYNAADDGAKGYSSVIVNVDGALNGYRRTFTQVGDYKPDPGKYFSECLCLQNNFQVNEVIGWTDFIEQTCDYIWKNDKYSLDGIDKQKILDEFSKYNMNEASLFTIGLSTAYSPFKLLINLIGFKLETELPFVGLAKPFRFEWELATKEKIDMDIVRIYPRITHRVRTLNGGYREINSTVDKIKFSVAEGTNIRVTCFRNSIDSDNVQEAGFTYMYSPNFLTTGTLKKPFGLGSYKIYSNIAA